MEGGVQATAEASKVEDAPDLIGEEATTVAVPLMHEPYVQSRYGKFHRVSIGHPARPANWMTLCGWSFGYSPEASARSSTPIWYQALCERCFTQEREMAKQNARAGVSEVWGLL